MMLFDELFSLMVTRFDGRYQVYLTNLPNGLEAQKFLGKEGERSEEVVMLFVADPQPGGCMTKPSAKLRRDVRRVQIMAIPDEGQGLEKVERIVLRCFNRMHRGPYKGGEPTFH